MLADLRENPPDSKYKLPALSSNELQYEDPLPPQLWVYSLTGVSLIGTLEERSEHKVLKSIHEAADGRLTLETN